MSSVEEHLRDPLYANWVKSSLALNITNDVLRPFVGREITQLHQTILAAIPGGASCTSCTVNTADACASRICSHIKHAIETHHWFPNPSFQNTSIESWCTDPWEIAKCYMPKGKGYKNSSAADADFSTSVNVIMNCRHFVNCDPNRAEDKYCKAREFRNTILHSDSMKVSDNELETNLDILIDILQEITTHAFKDDADTAIAKINEIKDNKLTLTMEDVLKVRKQAMEAQDFTLILIQQGLQTIKAELEQGKHTINEHVEQRILDIRREKVQGGSLISHFVEGCQIALCRLTEEHIMRLRPDNIMKENWTISDFLSKLVILREKNDLSDEHQAMLFPLSGTHLGIKQWDLFIYCFLLTEIEFTFPTENAVIGFVQEAKKLRNEFLRDHTFVTKLKLSELCDNFLLDADLKKEIHIIFSKNPSVTDVTRLNNILLSWRTDEENYSNTQVRRKNYNAHKELLTKVDEMQCKLKELEQDMRRVKGLPLEDEEERPIYTRCKVNPQECDERLKKAVEANFPTKNTEMNIAKANGGLEHFRKELDLKEVNPEEGSIILEVTCSSIKHLVEFWDSCMDGRAVKALSYIRDDYRDYFKCDTLEFEVVLSKKEVTRCINQIVEDLPAELYSGINDIGVQLKAFRGISRTGQTSCQTAGFEEKEVLVCEKNVDEKDTENTVKFYLEAFEAIICSSLSSSDLKDLIVNYDMFGPDEKTRLSHYGEKNTPSELFHEIVKAIRNMKDNCLKYTELAIAFKKIGHQKIYILLIGDGLPEHETYNELYFKWGVLICKMLDVETILPSIFDEDLISTVDRHLVEKTLETRGNWSAAFELWKCLSNRRVEWYTTFMKILLQNKHEDLANILDNDDSSSSEDNYEEEVYPDNFASYDASPSSEIYWHEAVAGPSSIGAHAISDDSSSSEDNYEEEVYSDNFASYDASPSSESYFHEVVAGPSSIGTHAISAVSILSSTSSESCFEEAVAGPSSIGAHVISDDSSSSEDSYDEEEYPDNLASYDEESSTSHKLILRDYQLELAENALAGKNTVIIAGTGSGKTWLTLHIVKEHFLKAEQGTHKVAFMARTSALITQQANRFKRYLPELETKLVKGEKDESNNLRIYIQLYDILCFTPQILVNNLDNRSITSLSEFSLIILDKCHHTKGDDPYNILMRKYLIEKTIKKRQVLPQVVGLTASIGVGRCHNDEDAFDHLLHVFANLDVRVISTVQRCKDQYENAMEGRSRKQGGHHVIMGNEEQLVHEGINAYKLAMMQRALKRFLDMDPNIIDRKISLYQGKEWMAYRIRKHIEEAMRSRKRKSTDDDLEIRCRRCNTLACYTSDIRMVKFQYIVIDKSFEKKIILKPHNQPKTYDGFHRKFKMYCKECPLDWGIVSENKGLLCRTLKLESFNLRNTQGGKPEQFKKWGDVPVIIPEIDVDDLTRMLGGEQQE